MRNLENVAKEIVIDFRAKIEEYPAEEYPPDLEYIIAKRCAILCAKIIIDDEYTIEEWKDILFNLEKYELER
jgi:hypothetical protein